MRVFYILVSVLFSQTIQTEIFTRYFERTEVSGIEILEKSKLHINENCYKNFEECSKFLKSKIKSKHIENKKNNLIGNPASHFCLTAGGSPEIFHDNLNKQYDFCNFEEKYIIDSWDYYTRLK